ncbi:uncharacterized protein K452DRAFT_275070 [Aplosporella prunicola CBS 121167]|uniref:DUF3074 domain-containing protein n=1 Tax=Aplosporella prunicola CBS 121167 TaxID=1176127 RepID=A0A6A6B694_9PEZI|nr:uncharacterized protein K452DRAFT_275070 [Aplosporella prunicola CBS 121167]KAF2139629.1 hypothetical protein K452DRAFT_275070 [Aplosporella prunicola CBS 121167]
MPDPLHEALECLRPKDFSDVPLDQLEGFLHETFGKAELIVNSVPQPPGGTDFQAATRTRKDVNGAHNASEITAAEARGPPLDPSFEELHKAWGKPVKLGAKENQMGISVWKMAGADRHGAWFARRSVHEGMGFAKWKKAMQREFAESLATQGGPGEGAIRGIGGDRRLEESVVEGVGKMEVLQLAAQFPGPTAPREFITLLLTSDNALTKKSIPQVEHKSADRVPRHYIVVSIPCQHPDAPPRDGLVLGHYESVEMIREIPLTPDDDPETNPVEWIMITRSDPGGGIPRFLVDRGTPGSIAGDTVKFLNWACALDDIPDPDVDKEQQNQVTKLPGEEKGLGRSLSDDHSLTEAYEPQQPSQDPGAGMMSTIASGIAAYAPNSVQHYLQQSSQSTTPSPQSDSASETSSIDSFASAEQYTTAADGANANAAAVAHHKVPSSESLVSTSSKSNQNNQSRYEKEMQKLEAKRLALDEKLRKSREKEQSRSQQLTEKEEREKRKAEEKYEKEMAKLQAKREKEAQKLEQKRQKDAEKNDKTRLVRERDEWKEKADMMEHENRLLKEQIRELQHENTLLVQKVGKTDVGQHALRQVSDELGRERSLSNASSRKSRKSGSG